MRVLKLYSRSGITYQMQKNGSTATIISGGVYLDEIPISNDISDSIYGNFRYINTQYNMIGIMIKAQKSNGDMLDIGVTDYNRNDQFIYVTYRKDGTNRINEGQYWALTGASDGLALMMTLDNKLRMHRSSSTGYFVITPDGYDMMTILDEFYDVVEVEQDTPVILSGATGMNNSIRINGKTITNVMPEFTRLQYYYREDITSPAMYEMYYTGSIFRRQKNGFMLLRVASLAWSPISESFASMINKRFYFNVSKFGLDDKLYITFVDDYGSPIYEIAIDGGYDKLYALFGITPPPRPMPSGDKYDIPKLDLCMKGVI